MKKSENICTRSLLVRVATVSFLCILALWTRWTIKRRVLISRSQSAALLAMSRDPSLFLWYATTMPSSVSPLGLNDEATSARTAVAKWEKSGMISPPNPTDNEFATNYIAAYGQWMQAQNPVILASMVNRHCGAREFKLIAQGESDAVNCGSSGPNAAGACRAGFFRASDNRVEVCPDGTFCLEGQSCFILCVEGAACNASRPILLPDKTAACTYAPEKGTPKRIVPVDPVILKCPGTAFLELCPARSYCPSPIQRFLCPRGFFCPRGSVLPLRCPFFSRCQAQGLDRPHSFYRSLFAFVCLCIAFLTARYRRRRRWLLLVSTPVDVVQVESAITVNLDEEQRTPLNPQDFPTESIVSPLIDLSFRNLTCTVGSKVLLEQATGCCLAGHITACIGSSGVGKTTLLRLLVGQAPPRGAVRNGMILLNGVDRRKFGNGYAKLFGLVPQTDDSLLRWITVGETLRFYAQLRGINKEDTNSVVQKLVTDLQLQSATDALVAVLSGGMKKRLSLGLELIISPPVLALDEPTSSVDSTTSLAVIRVLRKAARRGVCVIAVLHQPSSSVWRALDDVVVMGIGGITSYVGPTTKAAEYYSSLGFVANTVLDSEFVLDCVSTPGHPAPHRGLIAEMRAKRDTDHGWSQATEDHIYATEASIRAAIVLNRRTVDWYSAWLLFSRRCCLEIRRHPYRLGYDVSVVVAAGSLSAALYPKFNFRESQEVAFVVMLTLGFTVALSAARTFGEDRYCHFRELSTRGGTHAPASAFFLAKILIIDIPQVALLVLSFLIAWYPTAAPVSSIGTMYTVCFAAALTSAGAAHLVTIVQEASTSQLSLVALLVASAISSGVAPTLHQLRNSLGEFTARMMSWWSYSRWLCESLFAIDLISLSTAFRMPPAVYRKPRNDSALAALIAFQYDADAAWIDVNILIILALLFRFLAYLGLHAAHRDKRGLPPLSTSLLNWISSIFRFYCGRHEKPFPRHAANSARGQVSLLKRATFLVESLQYSQRRRRSRPQTTSLPLLPISSASGSSREGHSRRQRQQQKHHSSYGGVSDHHDEEEVDDNQNVAPLLVE